jgi:hypothetical protein
VQLAGGEYAFWKPSMFKHDLQVECNIKEQVEEAVVSSVQDW